MQLGRIFGRGQHTAHDLGGFRRLVVSARNHILNLHAHQRRGRRGGRCRRLKLRRLRLGLVTRAFR